MTLLSNELTHMSIKIKRQSLMGDSTSKKKVKKREAPKSRVQPQSPSTSPSQTAKSSASSANNKPKKGLWFTIAFFALLAIVIPKPKMISYQKLNVVGTSIYWSGFLGIPATILDSDLTLAGEIEQGKIYLCDDINQNVGCQKYQIVKEEGFISVISHLISD